MVLLESVHQAPIFFVLVLKLIEVVEVVETTSTTQAINFFLYKSIIRTYLIIPRYHHR